jgi:hypothetical protein
VDDLDTISIEPGAELVEPDNDEGAVDLDAASSVLWSDPVESDGDEGAEDPLETPEP